MDAASTCALCGGASRVWTSREGRDLRRCGTCRFSWVPQGLLMRHDGRSIYEHDPPIFLVDGNTDYYLDDSAHDNARAKVEWIAGFVRSGARLLDVGANFGHFASAARASFEVTGIEPSPTAAAWARAHLDVPIRVASIYDPLPAFAGRFDAVTLFDVIEHLPDPPRAIAAVRTWLARGGRVFITTPDTGSLLARALGRRWHHYDLVQHIALFDRASLARLLAGAGFRVLASRRFGRLYRLSYVKDRLAHLARTNGLCRVLHRILPLHVWPDRRVRINLGDVIGVVAEVRP
jgi:2-polyprenyl-3-methyl-5-hydroxy-6-metoxy-1,4-benzoquinol methylase